MAEEKTRMRKIIENGKIKYARVPLSLEDELQEKDLEISRLKKLVDELRLRIDQLEDEQRRRQLIDKEAGPIESYSDMYK